jgi:hypothetical protein
MYRPVNTGSIVAVLKLLLPVEPKDSPIGCPLISEALYQCRFGVGYF